MIRNLASEEFVKAVRQERDELLDVYFNSNKNSLVQSLIESMELEPSKRAILKEIIKTSLADGFSILLNGLEGNTFLGEKQQGYTVEDEEGNIISDGNIGELTDIYLHEKQIII